ncbi:MAG: efflux RND transporter periplasmic adaptor subunit [Bdellovibrionales bacterium]|nr:efflux RND transporter periplasmic adaptor subunit [Ramlibacter sp.]
MNRKNILIAVAVAAVLAAAAGYGLYRLGTQHGTAIATAGSAPALMTMAKDPAPTMAVASSPPPMGKLPQGIPEGEAATRRHIVSGLKAGDMDTLVGRNILYYHDPMVPGNKFDKPAKSPFMDMMLVPVYGEAPNAAAGTSADTGKVSISPRVQQNLGVRTALVTQGMLSPELSAVGNIAFNERDQAIVQARAAGYVERLHVRATLDKVTKGQALVDLYVPEWIAAQEEFLSLRRMAGASANNGLASLVDGARQRMRLAGMSDALISQVEASGRPQARTTITAPVSGVVAELMVREGMTVTPGTTLFRINGLGTVWANAEVPEGQAALLRPGTRVVARTPAAPGTAYEGTVQALLPEVNAATRTLKARVELRNPGMQLVPGMFVSMQFMDKRSGAALLIPTEAVIQTGKRSVVMLAEDNGRFRPVQVETGIESAGQTQVLRGLQAGQRVVVSSQFLIDSEASLRGFEARLNDVPATGARP